MRRIICAVVFLNCSVFAFSQDDLLKSLGTDSVRKEYVTSAFKSSRVINGHSMEFIGKGCFGFSDSSPFWSRKPGDLKNFLDWTRRV